MTRRASLSLGMTPPGVQFPEFTGFPLLRLGVGLSAVLSP